MLAYALRRLLLALPLLLGITFVSFVVIHLAPGDPSELQSGDLSMQHSAQAYKQMREEYGLDKPLPIQYWNWLSRLARLDFGRSFAPDGRPVLAKIGERLPITLLLMILFGVRLDWLPVSGLRSLNWEYLSFWRQQWDFLGHLALPILVATFGGLAGFSRYMRQSMLEVIRQDYIQSARAKGLAERVVVGKHALRNALLPIVTILGLSLPGLIGGSVIVEWIFAIPGMGQLMVQAAFERDYPVLMGNLVIVSTLTLTANLAADIAYSLVDPRIRVGRRRR